MPYVLGVDVGHTHTTAALYRSDEDGPAVLPLDLAAPARLGVHSVLYLARDDTVLVGRDALARAASEPDRVARGFVDRIGDPVSPLLGGRPCPPEMLTAALVSWVVDRAVDIEQDEPDRVVLTHPATWGPYRRGLLDAALRQAGLPGALLLPRPIAAAESHAAAHPMAPGDTLAVYDLGGQSACCALTRFGPAGFAVLRAGSAGQCAGAHFDDLLTAHVLGELARDEQASADLDPADEEVRAAVAELRSACRAAKERLSSTAEAIVPTPLFGPPSSVLVTRAGFDELVGPTVARSVDLLQCTIRSAGSPEHAPAVTLVGGSARVPLVAELVRAAMPGRVSVAGDPDAAVARGAAIAGRRVATVALAEPAAIPEQREQVDPDAPTQPPRPPVELAPLDVPLRGARRWKAGRRRAG